MYTAWTRNGLVLLFFAHSNRSFARSHHGFLSNSYAYQHLYHVMRHLLLAGVRYDCPRNASISPRQSRYLPYIVVPLS
ncbi:hypothetical protein BJV74DRAFT_467071 [Russula compacta]|nr:hypothetical protein BJV74DRAFT_467071 [Russula compacta]